MSEFIYSLNDKFYWKLGGNYIFNQLFGIQ